MIAPVMAGGADATRQRLLAAAVEIAGREGQGCVTYRSVARRAGVAHSLVHYYFGTREALLSEAIEQSVRRIIDESGLRSDTVDAFVFGLADVLDTHVDRRLLLLDHVISAIRGHQPLELAGSIYDACLEQVSETLTSVGIDDPNGTWAAVIFAAVEGLTLQHGVYGSRARTEQLLDQLRELLRIIAAQRPA